MAASAALPAGGVACSGVLSSQALPVIDLRSLTQSELLALSKSSSNSSAEVSRLAEGGDCAPVPKIDRAVFNESAGSRKQTYSRLRLAPRKPEATRSRIGEVRCARVEVDEAEDWENRRIVGLLKELIGEEGSAGGEAFEGLMDVEVECDPELNAPDVELVRHPVLVEVGVVSPVRRKRGRPRKDSDVNVSVSVNKIVLYDDSEDGDGDGDEFRDEKLDVSKAKSDVDDMEMVNRNGEVVDLVALGTVDDPFGPELRRRTEGMGTKEQLLEFLTGLEGRWVSRRRKRKIVDASRFGDALPRGWKLLLLIKKKAGHAWLVCQRFISPSGRDFNSCKEVSSFLHYLSGIQCEEPKIPIGNNVNVMPVEKIAIDDVQHASGMQSQDKKIPVCNDENVVATERNPVDNVAEQVVQVDVVSYHHHPSESVIPNLATQVEPESEITFSEMAQNDHPLQIILSSPKKKPESETPFSEKAKNDHSQQILPSSPKRKPESDIPILVMSKFDQSPQIIVWASPNRKPETEVPFPEVAIFDQSPQIILQVSPKRKPENEVPFPEMAKFDQSSQISQSSPKRNPESETSFSEMAKMDPSQQLLPLSPKRKTARETPFPEMPKINHSPRILPTSPKSKSKRRKLGTLVSDGVIIKDGKFECQFCHKIFDERRRYNGHVGVHVRSASEALRGKGAKPASGDLGSASEALPVASGLNITSFYSGASHRDGVSNDGMGLEFLHAALLQGSEVGDWTEKSHTEMSLKNVNREAVFGISHDKSDRDCEMADDTLRKLDNSFRDEAEMNHSVMPQMKFEVSGLNEPSEGSRICVSDVKTIGEDGNSEKSTVVYNVAGKESRGDKKSMGDSSSFGGKLNTDVEGIQPLLCAENNFNAENNAGGLVRDGIEEHTIDFTEQFGNERSPFNLGLADNVQEDVCTFYQQRSTRSSPIASFLNEQRHGSISCENEAVASKLMEYKEIFTEKGPPNLASSKQALSVNSDCLNEMSGSSSKLVGIDASNSRIQPAVVSTSNHVATHGENDWSRDTPQKIFGVTYLFPSMNQQGASNAEVTSTDVASKSPWKSPTCNPQPAISSVDRAPNVMANKEFWKAVADPNNSAAKIVNEAQLGMDVESGLEHEKGSGGYSFSSIGNEQGFNIRNDMVEMGDNSMQERRPERDYVSDFVNPFENGLNNQAINSKMFPTRLMEQSRADEVRFPLNSELKISLGNNQSRLEGVNRNLKGQSLVLSGNEQFGLQNNSNTFYSTSVEEQRDQRARGSGLFDQFGQQDQLFGLQSNLNHAYNGSTWGEQRVGPVGSFRPNDLMPGFGSSQPQRSENVLAGFGSSQPQCSENVLAGFSSSQPQRSENVLAEANWRLGASSHSVADASLSRDQPSGYLHNLQMITSKGDNQLYAVPQKFNNLGDFQDQRGGIQQREYNFLNAQAKPYPQEPNVMQPYQQQMQQSYDS
uniref:C2H2-type domain-containing protein n=1 Tax=Kalanchoe fedtschenkoi TaxID=63787 RepID=A0A7N0UKY8_KALFE